jgi:hypothetical protein
MEALCIALGINRDAFRIHLPGQLAGIRAAFDIGNLGRSECHHFIVRVVTEEDVEVVEIAPGGAHDESTDRGHKELLDRKDEFQPGSCFHRGSHCTLR